MSAEERQRLRDEAQALKHQRTAEREAKKKHRVAAQESKKRRTLLLSETLAELGAPAKKPSAQALAEEFVTAGERRRPSGRQSDR